MEHSNTTSDRADPDVSAHTDQPLLLADTAKNNRMSSTHHAENGLGMVEFAADAETRQKVDKGPPKWRSQRYILGYFLCVGMANLFFQRVNISIAIVCMVNHTAISSHKHYSPLIEITNGSTVLNVPPPVANFSSLGDRYSGIQPASPIGSPNSTARSLQYNQGYTGGSGELSSRTNGSVYSFSSIGNAVADNEEGVKDGMQGIKDTKQKEEKREPETDGRCSAEALVKEEKEDGPLLWSKQEQGLLLGAVYWTYTSTSIPGNYLLRNIRRKTVILVSFGIMTVMTMLIPVASLWSLWAVFVVRLVQGACTAVGIIAIYGMWTVWGPPRERGSLLAFNIAGQMISNIAVFPVSALLCKYGFLGGWPSVFYVFGLFSFVWLVLVAMFVEESPSTSRFITEGEKNYILSSLSHSGGHAQLKIPWKAIFTSRAMWSVIFLQVSFAWNYFMFLATLPQYMFEVLKMDIQSNGIFSMLPYICVLVVTYISGTTTDWIIKRGFLSVVWVRRISGLIANLVPAVCLCVLSYMDCTQKGLVITLLAIGVGMSGISLITFQLLPYDVAPRFAPAILSVSNTFATTAGVITPLAAAAIAKDQTREQWQMVFFLTAGILVVGAVGFCLLAQGEVQKWAMPETGCNLNIEFEVDEGGLVEKEKNPLDKRKSTDNEETGYGEEGTNHQLIVDSKGDKGSPDYL